MRITKRNVLSIELEQSEKRKKAFLRLYLIFYVDFWEEFGRNVNRFKAFKVKKENCRKRHIVS